MTVQQFIDKNKPLYIVVSIGRWSMGKHYTHFDDFPRCVLENDNYFATHYGGDRYQITLMEGHYEKRMDRPLR